MSRFLLDENMPTVTARTLRARGHEVLGVWECGLAGKRDEEVYRYAMKDQAIIITRDRGFGHLCLRSEGVNPGVVIVTFPKEIPSDQMNRRLDTVLLLLPDDDIRGNLVIVEPGKLRIRRGLK
jgi:predicted nuclease of predicted toxin-antitoxin system